MVKDRTFFWELLKKNIKRAHSAWGLSYQVPLAVAGLLGEGYPRKGVWKAQQDLT